MADSNRVIPQDLVVIEGDGTLRAVGKDALDAARRSIGSYRLVLEGHGLWVLRAMPSVGLDPEDRVGTRVILAGEIIHKTTILEVINVIASSAWRGELHIVSDDARRVLSIDKGSIKSARSDHEDDRLGQVLYRNGVLSKQQLDALVDLGQSERRFGQLVLEQGWLTQEVLFAQLQEQVEQISFATLLTHEGNFIFLLPDELGEPPVHTVHLPLNGLLMEGVQQIDEMALFREWIPDDFLVPEVQPRMSLAQLEKSAQLVVAYMDGERTISDIARESGLGLFATIKTLYGLLQDRTIVLRHRKAIDHDALISLVAQVNSILRDIFLAVAAYGGVDGTRATLEQWLGSAGYGALVGAHLGEDGTLFEDAVIAGVERMRGDNPAALLLQVFHELTAFALFAATTALPREQELALSRDVNRRLKSMRLA